MIKLFKKLLLIIALISVCFNISASAEALIKLNAPKNFYDAENNPEKLSEILNMTEKQLEEYCKSNSVLYLGADKDNSKQIQITNGKTNFSNSIVNISNMTDDKITALAPDLSGIEGIRGEIEKLNSQKFLKIVLKTNDEGGEYILTQYITIAQRQNIIISFYTDADLNTDYVDDIFKSITSPLFIFESDNNGANYLYYIVPIAAGILFIVCIILGFSVIKDLKNAKEDYDNYPDEISEEAEENKETENQENNEI